MTQRVPCPARPARRRSLRSWTRTCALTGALGLAACGHEPAPAADAPQATAAPVDAGGWRWWDAQEAAAMRLPGARAARHGIALDVLLAGGRTRRFVDDTVESDQMHAHHYLGPVARTPFHLVRVSFYEGGAYLLVDGRTGRVTYVEGRPVASPAGTELAVANVDLAAEYDPTVLRVLRVVGDTVEEAYQLEPASQGWGPDSVAWHGRDSVHVMAVSDRLAEEERGTAWLTRDGAG